VKIEIRCERFVFENKIALYLMHGNAVAKDILFTVVEPGMYVEPSLKIDNDCAQGLIDELWRCGFRPTEGTGSAGSLAATERHLKDMQKIAFNSLKIND
jgi:hypothetical protein